MFKTRLCEARTTAPSPRRRFPPRRRVRPQRRPTDVQSSRRRANLFAGAPPYPFHAQVREATAPIFYKILTGEVGPDEGLDQMAETAEKELKNLGYRK